MLRARFKGGRMLGFGRRFSVLGGRFRRPALCVSLCAAVSIVAPVAAQVTNPPQTASGSDWSRIDYGSLVDRRQLSHSGESVGALLSRLAANPSDLTALTLLDPLLEPYAFVLPDAVDSAEPVAGSPLVEVGSLWQAAEAQPAWVELLRARHYLVESDGQGRLRVFLPAADPTGRATSAEAVRQAAAKAWPVLRHVFAAERKRLAQRRGEALEGQALGVEFRVYRHRLAESVFLLGAERLSVEVTDTRSAGRRRPLELTEIEQFLNSNLRLEGARLERDGTLRLLGSRVESVPTLLGRPVDLSDLAVAYRAVFHGGLAEPYMSLDRGYSPQTSIVNYGGRLRDTALGWISLLCDVRFKTFSQGLGIAEGRDLREEMRARIPSFHTHLERFAAHPAAQGLMSQHTRLWFYPDSVDLTVSAQNDLLAFRRVRMSASSERLADRSTAAAPGAVPPWTRATVNAINQHYDELAGLFSELGDLDQVVRLLSLFTWLKHAQSLGLATPELGALLALELPPLTTPRTYPQLLAFNALPPEETGGEVIVFDRVPVGEALARLEPASGRPLPARRRLARAMAGLDPADRQNSALIEEVARARPENLDDDTLDRLAFRAERLRMHQTVLSTLAPGPREQVAARFRAGEKLRIFSVGIGGLDLGMGQALANARSRSVGLVGVGAGGSLAASTRTGPGVTVSSSRPPASEPREAWRQDPAPLPELLLPEHGAATAKSSTAAAGGQHWIESGTQTEPPKQRWLRLVYGADGPEPRTRMIVLDDKGRTARIERLENGRLLSYRMQGAADKGWKAVAVARDGAAASSTVAQSSTRLPSGLATLELQPTTRSDRTAVGAEPPAVSVRLSAGGTTAGSPLTADFPRSLLQRVVTGRVADLTPNRPLSGFAPLPERLGQVETVMCLALPAQRQPPWEFGAAEVVGEEDPIRLCSALRDWWTDAASGAVQRGAVVGTDPERAMLRWLAAPRPAAATLVLPASGLLQSAGSLREELEKAWQAGPVVGDLSEAPQGDLVVLISADPPGLFAARLRELARSPALEGKLLAAWSLSGPVRQDLPASLLAEGKLAGLGLAEAGVVERRQVVDSLGALSRALAAAGESDPRVERLPGPFTWFF